MTVVVWSCVGEVLRECDWASGVYRGVVQALQRTPAKRSNIGNKCCGNLLVASYNIMIKLGHPISDA
eukprot:3401637-Amphidinium_carterae.1